MAIASLTVDLSADFSKFEGDLGKVTQIATRESEKLERSRRRLLQELEREAQFAGKSRAEVFALRAAYLGVTEQAEKYLQVISSADRVASRAAGAEGIIAVANAEVSANEKRRNSQAELVASIGAVSKAYVEQQQAILRSLVAGETTPDVAKQQLAQAAAARTLAIQQVRDSQAQQAAIQAVAEEERQAAESRRLAAQKIIDVQNGLTSTYRSQLAALRALRDAGDISPAQFKQAGAELVAKQPVQQQAAQRAAEEVAANERRRASAQQLNDTLDGLGSTYRKNLALLQEQLKLGEISPQQFQTRLGTLNEQRPDIKRFKEQQAAAEAAAAAEIAAAARAAAAQEEAGARFIQQLRDRVAAIGQTREALQALQAAELGVADEARGLIVAQGQREFIVGIQEEIASLNQLSAEFGKTRTQVLELKAAKLGVFGVASDDIRQLRIAQDQYDRLAAAARRAEEAKAADAAFIANINEQVAAQQKLADSFGKTATEVLTLQAAERGLGEQTAAAIARLEQLTTANQKLAAAKAAADTRTANQTQFLSSLEGTTTAIGKTRAELLTLQAAQLGVSKEASGLIAKIAEADRNINKFGTQTGVTKYQLLTLQYTISDVAASLASGISPFTILLQQGGQVADVFANNGGIGALFRTIASVFTPFRVAAAGAAGALGAIAYAAYQGAEQSKVLADAVVLSGNAAGVTEGKFNATAKAIAASGQVTVSAAREFQLALIKTGEVGSKGLDVATEAAARFGAATGKSAAEVAGQFATLNKDVVSGAAQLNQGLNFLTAAQLQQIRTLQEQGQSTDAVSLVYTALNDRLKQLEPNLGTLDRAIRAVTGTWKDFWDRAFDIGRAETIEQKIDKARAAAERARSIGTERVSQTQLDPERRARLSAANAAGAGAADVADENLRLLNRSKGAQEEAAAAAAELIQLNSKAAKADEFVQGQEKRAKASEGLARALKEANEAFAAQDRLAAKDANYKPSTAETRADILKKIREDFTDKPATTEANQVAKAERDKAIKAVQDQLKAEREAYDFQNQYLQGIYGQGLVSLQTFYASRRAATERDTQEQLNAIDEQIAVQQRYLAFIKGRDPSEAINAQKNIDTLNEQAAQLQAERQRKAVLANVEEAAAVKALNDRVTEYRANLLQLQGDELGAARLRTAQTIQAARILAQQSQGGASAITEEEIQRQERAIDVANRFAEVQRQNSIVSADANRLEEYYRLRATQSGAELEDTETGVYLIRQRSLEQLGELATAAAQLAAVSTDPKVQQFAADLALQYAKAADVVNPTIVRLREGGQQLGDSLAEGFGRAIKQATSFKDVLRDVVEQAKGFVIDFLITEPLKKTIGGFIRQQIDTGGLLQRFGGTSTDSTSRNYENSFDLASTAAEGLKLATISSQAATTTQTASIITNTSAMTALSAAATTAASSLNAITATSIPGGGAGFSSIFGGNDFLENPFAAVALADGTNYVPRDGLKATLHKGEAVVPAKFNPYAAGGRSGGGERMSVNVYNNNGSQVKTEQRADGGIDVIIDAAVSEIERRIGAGGSTDRVLRQTYGMGRTLARRN